MRALPGFTCADQPDGSRICYKFVRQPAAVRPPPERLAVLGLRPHALGMFLVSESDAAAICAAFDQGGEFSAAIEFYSPASQTMPRRGPARGPSSAGSRCR
jgi:hypothetical protein